MATWRFWRRRPARLDATGPATVYGHHGGAYRPDAPGRQVRPGWDDPTIILMTGPLMTPGQAYRSAGCRDAQ